MTLDLLLFVVGLALLAGGAEWLVGGASRLASTWGMSPLLVGLTIVAFGTSAPELLVSVVASARGEGALATGNVVGSNIANIALILGVCALIRPMRVTRGLVVRDVPLMIAFSLFVPLLAWNGTIARWQGVLVLTAFVLYMVHLGRTDTSETEPESNDAPATRIGRDMMLTLAGTAALAGGAHMLVESATSLARTFGIPEVIIGLTLVAFGTSVPELAASASAAVRGQTAIILGNVVGSNIFNITLVLGAAALVRPLPLEAALFRLEIPVMVGLAALLLPLIYTGSRLVRWEGALLLAGYVAFVAWLLL